MKIELEAKNKELSDFKANADKPKEEKKEDTNTVNNEELLKQKESLESELKKKNEEISSLKARLFDELSKPSPSNEPKEIDPQLKNKYDELEKKNKEMEEQISSLKSKLAEEKAKNEEVINTDRPQKQSSITNEELDKLLQRRPDKKPSVFS